MSFLFGMNLTIPFIGPSLSDAKTLRRSSVIASGSDERTATSAKDMPRIVSMSNNWIVSRMVAISCGEPASVIVPRASSALKTPPFGAVGSSTRFISDADTKRSWTTLV